MKKTTTPKTTTTTTTSAPKAPKAPRPVLSAVEKTFEATLKGLQKTEQKLTKKLDAPVADGLGYHARKSLERVQPALDRENARSEKKMLAAEKQYAAAIARAEKKHAARMLRLSLRNTKAIDRIQARNEKATGLIDSTKRDAIENEIAEVKAMIESTSLQLAGYRQARIAREAAADRKLTEMEADPTR